MAFSRVLTGSNTLNRTGTQFSTLWSATKGAMSLWFFVDVATSLVSNSAPYNLSALAGNVGGNIGIHLGNLVLGGGTNVDCLGMYYFTSGGQAPFARVNLTKGEWCFAIGEFSDADGGTLKITVYSPSNGKQTSTLTNAGSISTYSAAISFGGSFTGKLDNLAVYNDLLSTTDKDALYAGTKIPSEISSCTAYWLLDDDVSGNTSDEIGSNDLALNSAATSDPYNYSAIPDPNLGLAKRSISVLNCRIAFNAPVDIYRYNGGGYYAVASGGISITGMSINDTTNTYVGRVMANPTGIFKQGWDNRLDGNSNGPGTIYDAAYGYDFPIALDAFGKPTVFEFYRGLDSPVGGLGSTWCKARISLGLEMGPVPSAIRPSFIGTSGNKIKLSITGINLNAFTPVAVPVNASEQFWNDDIGYFKHPFSPLGPFLTSAYLTPVDTQYEYMADQAAKGTGPLMLGAISNSTSRNELIYRLLGLAANIKAYNSFNSGSFFLGAGGFGYGYAMPMFLASLWLNDASYNIWPSSIPHPTTSNLVSYYGEGQAFLGDPTNIHPYGIPLFGTNNESVPFPYNHNAATARAIESGLEPISLGNNGTLSAINVNGSLSRLAHQIPRYSNTAPVQTGVAVTGFKLPVGMSIPVGYTDPITAGERMYIYAGTGSGQTREIVSYVSGLHAATLSSGWLTQPDNTSQFRICNGGGYFAINMYSLSSHTMIPILINKTAEFINNEDRRTALLAIIMRWTQYDDGLMIYPWPSVQYLDNSVAGRKFGDIDGNWASVFHSVYNVGDWRPSQNMSNIIVSGNGRLRFNVLNRSFNKLNKTTRVLGGNIS